ncbi:alpha/beta hydrolase [Limnohabitans sp. TEGF004]|jgi:pimeloyl-ACP methyl ester carboxylesterase|uniref:alpha/beta fold hydrolase n=1 Tax=Limnohabitans sp. TEGF004 TaxID=2986281 RepID=UPI0023771D87|nr:alpha/beta hydrolase [Limnohabitans sp. TEGF004]BDU54533.1 alpha/beta hydrolase [Limnohabitans sp. TEGF004]
MEISRVEALSQRIVQPYAWGNAVWHVWGAGQAAEQGLEGQVADTRSNASKQPLVLLHGGSGSWTHWLRNVEHLAKIRTIWALDIPGFGDSDLPSGVSDADGLVPYVAEILANSFRGDGVDVMGFSFGAMTAGLVAAEYPNLIRQLILVGAPGLGLFSKELPMRGMTPDMDEESQRKVHRHNLNAMMFVHPDSVTDDVIDLQQANVARDRLRRRRVARTDVLAQAQTHWTCPVHGVWGVCDALYQGTLAQVPQVLSSMASFTVVPDAGHWVMFEKPDAFHAAVAPLLSR